MCTFVAFAFAAVFSLFLYVGPLSLSFFSVPETFVNSDFKSIQGPSFHDSTASSSLRVLPHR